MAELFELGGERVLRCDADGPPLADERRTTDLIGDALGEGATLVAVPVARLGPEFFRLRSGFAGMLTRKFANYRLKLAVVGDICGYVAASDALRDWVRECDRGGEVVFVPTFDDLATRLGPAPAG